jgi:hypothetical protein
MGNRDFLATNDKPAHPYVVTGTIGLRTAVGGESVDPPWARWCPLKSLFGFFDGHGLKRVDELVDDATVLALVDLDDEGCVFAREVVVMGLV